MTLETRKIVPNNPGLTIRTAQGASDARAISSLGSRVYSLTFGHSLSAEDLNAYLEEAYSLSQIAQELNDQCKHFMVVCDEKHEIIGFVQLTEGTTEDCLAKEHDPVELQRLYINPDYHGLGLGKYLITESEDLARKLGFKTIWLGVWEENIRAQEVYKKMGFVKVGSHGFKMGQCVQIDHIMRKSL
ncbi:acyl-CoA N-acyltransferase [Penicillium frequentans]|nr:acyl-CoA N-acyltransferase [Penicillium glabrum]